MRNTQNFIHHEMAAEQQNMYNENLTYIGHFTFSLTSFLILCDLGGIWSSHEAYYLADSQSIKKTAVSSFLPCQLKPALESIQAG